MATDNDELVKAGEAVSKGGGIPIVPILIVVVILVVISAVVWFVVWPMIFPAPPVEEETSNEAVDQVADTEANVYDPNNKPGIIEFTEPFLIKLKQSPNSAITTYSYLKVGISLEVADEIVQDIMKKDSIVMARLKDTINTFFAKKTSLDVQVAYWTAMKKDLKDEINSQFPESFHILRVNIHEFLEQPNR